MSNHHVETRIVNSTEVILFKGSPAVHGYDAPIGSILFDVDGNCSYRKTGTEDRDWKVDNGPDACNILTDAIKQTETIQTS